MSGPAIIMSFACPYVSLFVLAVPQQLSSLARGHSMPGCVLHFALGALAIHLIAPLLQLGPDHEAAAMGSHHQVLVESRLL